MQRSFFVAFTAVFCGNRPGYEISEDKDADVSVDTGNDDSNDDDSEESGDSSDDDSSEEEYEEDFSDEESDEEYGSRTAAFHYIGGMYEQIHERHGI